MQSDKMDRKRQVVVISGPSGVGKTTIGKAVVEDEIVGKVVEKVPTCTTRKPRPGEEEGKDYIFLTKTEFAWELSKGNFLEWVEIFGNFYGTCKKCLDMAWEKGKIPLLIIDVKGGRYVRQLFGEKMLGIFIMPPSMEELERRLRGRKGITEEDLQLRLGIAHEEMEEAKTYDYVVVNDDLSLAVKEVKDIISREIISKEVT